MFCKYCGNELPDNANFCPVCGKIPGKDNAEIRTDTEDEEETYSFVNEVTSNEDRSNHSGSILAFGILGLAFSSIFPVLGIIFSCIARSKVISYITIYGELDNRGRVGNGLRIGGLICSIIGLVVGVIYGFYFILQFLLLIVI